MRPVVERLVSFLTLLLAAFAMAQLASAQTLPDSRAHAKDQIADFHLHQSFQACGKKWLKRARQLGPEQVEWMLRRAHTRYNVAAGGRMVMTLELLSTASFRDCDVARTWSARETSVRVTYHLEDGSRRTQLFSFTNDDVFFDRRPTFFAGLGKALLRGVTLDGSEVGRWLPLDRLAELVSAGEAPPPPVVTAVVADAGVAGGM